MLKGVLFVVTQKYIIFLNLGFNSLKGTLFGFVWFDLVWFGLAWLGLIWFDLVMRTRRQ
jgi:hypothetical protein